MISMCHIIAHARRQNSLHCAGISIKTTLDRYAIIPWAAFKTDCLEAVGGWGALTGHPNGQKEVQRFKQAPQQQLWGVVPDWGIHHNCIPAVSACSMKACLRDGNICNKYIQDDFKRPHAEHNKLGLNCQPLFKSLGADFERDCSSRSSLPSFA